MQNSRLVKYGTKTLTTETLIIYIRLFCRKSYCEQHMCIDVHPTLGKKHCFSNQINDTPSFQHEYVCHISQKRYSDGAKESMKDEGGVGWKLC